MRERNIDYKDEVDHLNDQIDELLMYGDIMAERGDHLDWFVMEWKNISNTINRERENVAKQKPHKNKGWRDGHPRHENQVLVRLEYGDGKYSYQVDNWDNHKNYWNYIDTLPYCLKVSGWSEIEENNEK